MNESLVRPNNRKRLHSDGPRSRLALIENGFETARQALERSRRRLPDTLLLVADVIYGCFAAGGKMLVCGNGGSAADAQHFVAELVGRFESEQRPGLPALSLTADTAILTAWANDVAYEKIFARQVQALGRPGDLLLAISTSGQSRNVIEAIRAAQRQNLSCVALLGGDGGKVAALADASIVVPSSNTQRIQEVQILVLHLLCELIEQQLELEPLTTAVNGEANELGNGNLS